MANIVDNRLSLAGAPSLLDELAAALAGSDDRGVVVVLDLNKLAPLPAAEDGSDISLARRLLWGVDRNAAEARCARPAPDRLVYEFTTDWRRPLTAVETLASRYPTLRLELVWEDSDAAEVGFVCFRNGRTEKTGRAIGDLNAGAKLLARLGWREHAASWRRLLADT